MKNIIILAVIVCVPLSVVIDIISQDRLCTDKKYAHLLAGDLLKNPTMKSLLEFSDFALEKSGFGYDMENKTWFFEYEDCCDRHEAGLLTLQQPSSSQIIFRIFPQLQSAGPYFAGRIARLENHYILRGTLSDFSENLIVKIPGKNRTQIISEVACRK
ncbi:MAG: hypothetical protein Kow0029_19570 [Candidatus Rifleibacteriota bacterium]